MSAELNGETESLPERRIERRAVCEAFLYHEAQLLDDRELASWFELLTDDVEYRIPIRTTRERSAETEFSDVSFHMKEDRSSLHVRVERMQNDFAWSEDPPSRTRRHVTNVRVVDTDADTREVRTRNNLLVYLSRDDQTDPDLLSGEREDLLRLTDDGWRLAERTVYFDHTIIPTDSLSIIL